MAEIKYWQDTDVLDIELKKGKYKFSEEIANGIILDISGDGDILSIEILDAMQRLAKPIARRVAQHYALVK